MCVPCLVRPAGGGVPRLGHQLLDDYLGTVASRARPNTVLATAFDLKVFFLVVGKAPEDVDIADVLSFIVTQRQPRRGAEVVRIEDGEAGLSARTIKRRLASVTGLFEYLIVRGVVARNPVPRGLSTRTPSRAVRGVPLIRTPRTLPRVIDPGEVDALMAALRTRRDRAMVEAMLLGGLRRCEVLGLRLGDVRPGEKRLFIAEGKGGHQRIVPVSARFFTTLADYLQTERPPHCAADQVFVVLKGQRRGRPLSAAGLDEIIAGARRRAGIAHLTCHQLRHTCFTRLREAGMALGGDPGPGRPSLHRIHPRLPAFGQRLACRRIPAGGRGDRRPSCAGAVTPAPLSLAVDDASIVEDYLAAMRAAGRKTGRSTTQAAHTCQTKIARAGGWGGLTADQQLDAVAKARSFTSWLMVTGRIIVDAELLSCSDLRPGIPARGFCAADYHWFVENCSRIGVSNSDTAAQWNILAKIAAITGRSPCAVTDEHFDAARIAMTTAYARRGKPSAGRNVASVFHRLRLTLFHAGQISTLRPPTTSPPVSVTGWATVATRFAESAQRYVAQVTLSLRPSTVKAIEHDLREFGTWLADTHPEVGSCADLHREHIEAFKTWLCTHPRPTTRKPLNRVSIKNALINLHCFFTRITEWGYPNPPVRPLMFPGDLPIIDKPLPRFLDDAAAAKLLRATRADPDPLSRLIVELLARTGIRRSELLALTADAVVQIGSAYWLRIPIGKLHNDRYIPLHPQLKELLDDWISHHRPTGLRTNRLLLEHNRPISSHRVTKALRHLADTAGIGNVTAHQLRHTLATQAVNRGMSLDAIAALLGHYAGDLVKYVWSGSGLIESGEQPIEHFLAAELSFLGGVVALCLQSRAELDGGLEESAGFADGFEVAVQADGSGAVAVAEHAAVHLDSELAHFGAFGFGGQCSRLVVEGFDFFADGEVFVGDSTVGDSGVHEGHPHRSVPQQCGQGFEGHAAVDRLGRQGMPEAMRRNMADARLLSRPWRLPGRRGLGRCVGRTRRTGSGCASWWAEWRSRCREDP
ncbi:hypothetical protein IWGMT90018_25760 [Mycobacterium kiyosense]|nr:hypothetical protein IWGMT90018_25760 [Mycobacterium kiyosense]